MQLALFNGSPRGKTGNTAIMLEKFSQGFLTQTGNGVEKVYLNRINKLDEAVDMFVHAKQALLGFPLYTDAMPGIVKAFIEALEPVCGREQNPDLGFLVQSGFPEAHHSRYVERYLRKLTQRLGCRYVETIVKGGGEGIRSMSPWMTRKLFTQLFTLGQKYAETGQFDADILQKIATPERLPLLWKLLFPILNATGLLNSSWDQQLKANNAYAQRSARPFQPYEKT